MLLFKSDATRYKIFSVFSTAQSAIFKRFEVTALCLAAVRSPEPFLARLKLEVQNVLTNTAPSPDTPNFNEHLATSVLQV